MTQWELGLEPVVRLTNTNNILKRFMVTKKVDGFHFPNICIWLGAALIQKKVFSLIRDYDFREHLSPIACLLNDTLIPTTSDYILNMMEGKRQMSSGSFKENLLNYIDETSKLIRVRREF